MMLTGTIITAVALQHKVLKNSCYHESTRRDISTVFIYINEVLQKVVCSIVIQPCH